MDSLADTLGLSNSNYVIPVVLWLVLVVTSSVCLLIESVVVSVRPSRPEKLDTKAWHGFLVFCGLVMCATIGVALVMEMKKSEMNKLNIGGLAIGLILGVMALVNTFYNYKQKADSTYQRPAWADKDSFKKWVGAIGSLCLSIGGQYGAKLILY